MGSSCCAKLNVSCGSPEGPPMTGLDDELGESGLWGQDDWMSFIEKQQ